MNTSSEFFSRETVAGYDRDRLEGAIVALVGCGAAGNNIAQNLALSGVGEIRLIDPDYVEPSNVTRSPLFRLDRLRSERVRYKANECARAIIELSYASNPLVRTAVARIEDLGLGALMGCSVVIAAVDSLTVRARLADMTRLLGIPLVELGFSAPRGQVSVYPNQSAEEPCWRCLHPQLTYGSASCRIYAQQVVASGRIPATQTLAATFSALAAEAAIQAIHGEFPLGGHLVTLDIRRGHSRRLELTTDPSCPGVHRRFGALTRIDAKSSEPVSALLGAVHAELAEPVLHLPDPFLREAPCYACGTVVAIGKLARLVVEPPSCERCRTEPGLASQNAEGHPLAFVNEIAAGDELARWKAQRFSLRPGAVIELSDRASTKQLVVSLAGGADDLYVTRRRAVASAEHHSDDGFAVSAQPPDDGFAALG